MAKKKILGSDGTPFPAGDSPPTDFGTLVVAQAQLQGTVRQRALRALPRDSASVEAWMSALLR